MDKLDLNLLKLMLVLLEERSVTGAAQRLHLSQSAVSKQLARLRQQLAPRLGDPLFVRQGQGLAPTPRALALEPQLRQWLQQSDALLQPDSFEPTEDQAQFRLALAETAFHTVVPMLPHLAQAAPGLKLDMVPQPRDQFEQLQRGQLDLLILPRDTDARVRAPWHVDHLPAELSNQELYQSSHVCLMRQHHPALSQPWDLDALLALPQIHIWVEGSEFWLMDTVLDSMGHRRTPGAKVPDFHSAAAMAQHSDMMFVCDATFGAQLCQRFALATLPLPFALGRISYRMLWPKPLDADPAHQWLRTFLRQQCQPLRP
ncbi:LysR family transcriptional regulator [Ferrimonas marina]|uniref:DNA-binding transcriptional regulator, LysR family n=1 Tax=Ferrimonas marina TaxID=299255 RepID=A0A1M5VRJ2_9GAMM|nr:LysR family transcriptional regulator [Ferrimonas marina]SHH77886.1 DNA-binding transcriptional regulator, LysR family [Ferrimonas marina]